MIFMFSLTLITIAKSDSLTFNYPSFTPSLRSILLDGEDSSISGKPLPNHSGLAGFYGPVRIFNNQTGQVADFTTEFTFTVTTNHTQPHGDGFTFFLASLDFEFPDNSSGGFLGLFNNETAFNTSANKVVLVEFDTFMNYWDPPYSTYPHIGIDVNSIRSVATAEWEMDSEPDGAIGKAVISYGSSSKQLSVIVSYSNSTVPVTTLSYTVDLVNALQSEWVLVGFSASTGLLVETHDILSWFLLDVETEDVDWNALGRDGTLESDENRAHRPPPKPPNFTTDVEIGGGSAIHVVNGARSSAEVGAPTRGRWSTSTAEDSATERTTVPKAKPQGTTSNRWFSAISEGVPLWPVTGAESSLSGSTGNGAIAKVTEVGLLMRRLRRFVLLTPPPLLAAMFPWDRGGEGHNGSLQGRSVASGSGSVMVLLGAPGVAEVVKPIEDENRWRRAEEEGLSALGTGASSAAVGAATMAASFGDVTTTLKEKGFGAIEFCLLLGHALVSGAKIKGGKNNSLNSSPYLNIVSSLGQLQSCASHINWSFEIIGLQFYQWDPGGALHLTKTEPYTGKPLPDRSGIAGYYKAVRIFNNRTGKVLDFTTEFTFTVTTNHTKTRKIPTKD
ncbi:hypothetical protein PIB30_041627, partial [Stylosanthes scabra]|nr:hypothetical protein [Stylosanthes scabra]